jgi:hypothetical protein
MVLSYISLFFVYVCLCFFYLFCGYFVEKLVLTTTLLYVYSFLCWMSKNIFLLAFGIIIFWWSVFASWFWYTNLSFFDWTTTGKTLEMNITVDEWQTGFWLDINNPTTESQSLKLDFVSQMQTADGRTSCDMISGKEFWENLIWNMWNFSVDPLSTERRSVDFNFPVCTSWTFDACALQLAPTETNIWSFDVVEGKANFFTLYVSPGLNCTPFSVKIFPGSRPWSNFANYGEIRFYDNSKDLVYSWILETDELGVWILSDLIPSNTYYIIYKGQSHLASYLSGVEIIQWEKFVLDFTTGVNLYNTQNKSNLVDDWYKYQIAWDLRNTEWKYDFLVNWNDISVIVFWSGFVEWWISVLNPKNLNWDSAINWADIAIIGINFQLQDSFIEWGETLFVW